MVLLTIKVETLSSSVKASSNLAGTTVSGLSLRSDIGSSSLESFVFGITNTLWIVGTFSAPSVFVSAGNSGLFSVYSLIFSMTSVISSTVVTFSIIGSL